MLAAITQEVEKILSEGFLLGRSEAMITDYKNQIAEIDADVHQQSTKQNELSTAMVDAYEEYRDNRITKEAFKQQSEHFSAEHTECEMKERALLLEKAKCKDQLRQLTHLINMLRTYQDSRALTRELVEAFIEKMLIFPQQRIELRMVIPEINRNQWHTVSFYSFHISCKNKAAHRNQIKKTGSFGIP